mgnify:FL=1
MAHEIDMKKYKIRTDMIVESFDKTKNITGINHTVFQKENNITVEKTIIDETGEKTCGKKKGIYQTISFDDITDKDNQKAIEEVLISVLKEFLEEKKINKSSSCLVIGLGNKDSTPDSLGPLVVNDILVTKYLFNLGEVEEGYRDVSSFIPGVTGTTGIETKKVIDALIKATNPDFIIVIDALASSSMSRVNKTIQLTDTGIHPGSGVGNNREELSEESLKIPVIAIGVPTIVDAVTIVSDTFKYILKHFSYKIENIDNNKLKLVPNPNYLNHQEKLSKEEKESLLGMIGSLSEEETKQLLVEVLSPIDYNLMVTPKEVDFVMKKLSNVISKSINKSLHDKYNSTNL